MKLLITGGLGFVGRQLSQRLLASGHEVTAVGLRPSPPLIDHPHFHYLSADTTEEGPWQEAAHASEGVINLAGKTIFRRWSESYKKMIYTSRIDTTRRIVEALDPTRCNTLVSTSAVGYYGNRGDERLTEQAEAGHDFLAEVGRDWEHQACEAHSKGIRVALARLGIVLGRGGGALAQMVPAFKLFVGGPLGDGRQWFPWIHMDDLTAAIETLLEQTDLDGPFNMCAPYPVRNRELARTLGAILNRPALMPAPAFMIKLAMGELGDVLLASQRAIPQKLLEAGFQFEYNHLRQALEDLL